MGAVYNLAKSGFWNYRNTITPSVVALPIAIEGVTLAKTIYKQPRIIQEKLQFAGNYLIRSFTPLPTESASESVKKIAKNILIFSFCGAILTGAGFLSIYLLPSAMGITTAISVTILLGRLFINLPTYKRELIQAFSVKPEETLAEAHRRILKNVLKSTLYLAALTAALVAGHYVIAPLLLKGFSWHFYLPFQTKAVVFLEYVGLGLVHGGIALSHYRKGNRKQALFHLLVGLAACLFPLTYLHAEMRLHHSFYGILMMALPFRPVQFLGGIITFDSALYNIAPLRGYASDSEFVQYDFINLIVDHFFLFFNTYGAALITEQVNNQLSGPIPK